MQIITIDDQDFPDLLSVFQQAVPIGNYVRDGKVQFVRANAKLVMISPGEDPHKIAIRPVRGQSEAESVAKRLLEREQERGSTVTYNSTGD